MLNKLIDHFSDVTDLPIEVDEIVEQIKQIGIQDEIYLNPDDDMDPTVLRGVFNQTEYPLRAYRSPDRVATISYSSGLQPAWQRVVVAKELVHLFDANNGQTGTQDEVEQLLDDLVKPVGDYGLADFHVVTDMVALYRSLPLLLPEAALDEARRAVEEGHITEQDVAERSCLPVGLVALMLDEVWEKIRNVIDAL